VLLCHFKLICATSSSSFWYVQVRPKQCSDLLIHNCRLCRTCFLVQSSLCAPPLSLFTSLFVPPSLFLSLFLFIYNLLESVHNFKFYILSTSFKFKCPNKCIYRHFACSCAPPLPINRNTLRRFDCNKFSRLGHKSNSTWTLSRLLIGLSVFAGARFPSSRPMSIVNFNSDPF
jgi:hypothetical protein